MNLLSQGYDLNMELVKSRDMDNSKSRSTRAANRGDKRSIVWLHYRQVEIGGKMYAECQVVDNTSGVKCGARLAYHNSTSSLHTHLKNRHPHCYSEPFSSLSMDEVPRSCTRILAESNLMDSDEALCVLNNSTLMNSNNPNNLSNNSNDNLLGLPSRSHMHHVSPNGVPNSQGPSPNQSANLSNIPSNAHPSNNGIINGNPSNIISISGNNGPSMHNVSSTLGNGPNGAPSNMYMPYLPPYNHAQQSHPHHTHTHTSPSVHPTTHHIMNNTHPMIHSSYIPLPNQASPINIPNAQSTNSSNNNPNPNNILMKKMSNVLHDYQTQLFVANYMQPYISESILFSNFVRALNPNVKILSSRELTNEYVPSLLDKMNHKIAYNTFFRSVSLSLDYWKSTKNDREYINVCTHWLCEQSFQLVHAILGVIEILPCYTEKEILKKLRDITFDNPTLRLDYERVISITIEGDIPEKIIAAVRCLQLPILPCIFSILKIGLQNALATSIPKNLFEETMDVLSLNQSGDLNEDFAVSRSGRGEELSNNKMMIDSNEDDNKPFNLQHIINKFIFLYNTIANNGVLLRLFASTPLPDVPTSMQPVDCDYTPIYNTIPERLSSVTHVSGNNLELTELPLSDKSTSRGFSRLSMLSYATDFVTTKNFSWYMFLSIIKQISSAEAQFRAILPIVKLAFSRPNMKAREERQARSDRTRNEGTNSEKALHFLDEMLSCTNLEIEHRIENDCSFALEDVYRAVKNIWKDDSTAPCDLYHEELTVENLCFTESEWAFIRHLSVILEPLRTFAEHLSNPEFPDIGLVGATLLDTQRLFANIRNNAVSNQLKRQLLEKMEENHGSNIMDSSSPINKSESFDRRINKKSKREEGLASGDEEEYGESNLDGQKNEGRGHQGYVPPKSATQSSSNQLEFWPLWADTFIGKMFSVIGKYYPLNPQCSFIKNIDNKQLKTLNDTKNRVLEASILDPRIYSQVKKIFSPQELETAKSNIIKEAQTVLMNQRPEETLLSTPSPTEAIIQLQGAGNSTGNSNLNNQFLLPLNNPLLFGSHNGGTCNGPSNSGSINNNLFSLNPALLGNNGGFLGNNTPFIGGNNGIVGNNGMLLNNNGGLLTGNNSTLLNNNGGIFGANVNALLNANGFINSNGSNNAMIGNNSLLNNSGGLLFNSGTSNYNGAANVNSTCPNTRGNNFKVASNNDNSNVATGVSSSSVTNSIGATTSTGNNGLVNASSGGNGNIYQNPNGNIHNSNGPINNNMTIINSTSTYNTQSNGASLVQPSAANKSSMDIVRNKNILQGNGANNNAVTTDTWRDMHTVTVNESIDSSKNDESVPSTASLDSNQSNHVISVIGPNADNTSRKSAGNTLINLENENISSSVNAADNNSSPRAELLSQPRKLQDPLQSNLRNSTVCSSILNNSGVSEFFSSSKSLVPASLSASTKEESLSVSYFTVKSEGDGKTDLMNQEINDQEAPMIKRKRDEAMIGDNLRAHDNTHVDMVRERAQENDAGRKHYTDSSAPVVRCIGTGPSKNTNVTNTTGVANSVANSDSYNANNNPSASSSKNQGQSANVERSNNNSMSRLQTILSIPPESIPDEWNKYEMFISECGDIVNSQTLQEGWRLIASNLPLISYIARKKLSCIGTAKPTVLLFSYLTNKLKREREELSPESVCNLVRAHDNVLYGVWGLSSD